MSTLQGDGLSTSGAVEPEASPPAAEQSGEHRLDQTDNGQGIGIEEDEREQEPDEDPAAAAMQNSTRAASTKIFGTMRKSNPSAKKGNDAYNYEEKYPEDPIYEETAPNARVWRTYEDESKIHDANMVEESRDNVDLLLVFAGLFSAVVTTFVAQTSQSLQPDYAAMSASLLYESVLVQRAIANGSSVNSITPSPLNPNIPFVPATTDVWVNGLWFTSLFLSLTTALVAVLVKQWLHHYVALPSGTPRDRSFTRQFRYVGFQKWHVQVIIGLLPVLMHLALAIFLGGLVVFLHPLQVALSWIIFTATALVFATYLVAAILPILFPQCPYRTPLCDLIYISFYRIIPRVSWTQKHRFVHAWKRRSFGDMMHWLPRLRTRNTKPLKAIESESVRRTSVSLAAEALEWLFSVSSNPSVQSIVVQSIGGLPIASDERLLALQGDNRAMDNLRHSLLSHCIRMPDDHISFREPIPGMELRLERLLRFHFRFTIRNSFGPFNIDLSELSVAIISSGLFDTEHLHPTDFFMGVITRSLKLPPRCWARFTMSSKMKDIFKPLEPDTDDHARMMFALHLSSAILSTVGGSRKGLMQDFDSPLVLDFKHALPYFLDEIYGRVLRMFSNFVKDPSLHEPSLPQSLRVVVAAMEFLLHRLSVSESDMSFHESLSTAARWIRYQKFSSQEAKAVMTVLGDIFVPYVIPQRDDDIALQWHILCDDAILAYESLATTFPSACSLHDLQLMAHYMTINWDYAWNHSYRSDTACKVLATLLSGHIPAAFRVFLDNQCLEFLGNHAFHIASVSMVSEYVAGIFSMKHGSDGVVDAATLQLHMDYLHNPRNLFTVCSILATRGIKDTDEISIRRDITMLVQLRQRDAAWDECRRKLHDLAQSDAGGDFFGKQCIDFRPLQAEEVQVEKDNIGYAIQVLDDLFSGRVRTMVTSNSSSAQHRTGRIDRFLVSRLGRKSEAKSEQAQQV